MKWPAWFRLLRNPRPLPPASPTACPACGDEMVVVEKFTMMGDDIRTYRCKRCKTEHDIDFGTALWKLMSDANERDSGE